MTSHTIVSRGKSIRFGFTEVSLLAAIAVSLAAPNLASAGDKATAGRICTDARKTAAVQTISIPELVKIATQKRMHDPWEKTDKGGSVVRMPVHHLFG